MRTVLNKLILSRVRPQQYADGEKLSNRHIMSPNTAQYPVEWPTTIART